MTKGEYLYILKEHGVSMEMFYECFCDKNPTTKVTLQQYNIVANKKFNFIIGLPNGRNTLELMKHHVQVYLDRKFGVVIVLDEKGESLLRY